MLDVRDLYRMFSSAIERLRKTKERWRVVKREVSTSFLSKNGIFR